MLPYQNLTVEEVKLALFKGNYYKKKEKELKEIIVKVLTDNSTINMRTAGQNIYKAVVEILSKNRLTLIRKTGRNSAILFQFTEGIRFTIRNVWIGLAL